MKRKDQKYLQYYFPGNKLNKLGNKRTIFGVIIDTS